MATPLCTLQNLTLTYPLKLIFKEVTFTLNEGDKIGVLGLNGHGKSSLFKIMAGLQTPDTTVPPFIYDRNKDLTIFHVPQELPHLSSISVEDYFYEFYPDFKRAKIRLDEIGHKLSNGEGNFDQLLGEQERLFEELHKGNEDRLHTQYMSYLRSFGLPNLERSVNSLSGGEQRKIALALGLSCPHQVILWDEPTNHLDLETIQYFEEELQNSRKTFMIISHDRSLLTNVVDRIIHIQHGKLKSFQGTYEEYLIHLQEEQARREKELDKLSNYNRRETAWIRRGAKARRTKSKKRIEEYGNLNAAIANLKAQAHKSVSLNLQSSGRKTKVLVQAENLGLRFGDRQIFSGLNFNLAKGDKIALMGHNGAGKSSLLNIILGLLEPTSGSVKKVDTLDVGHFSQKREALPLDKTPWEVMGDGTDFIISNTGDKKHVASYLESFLFRTDEIKRPIHTFSGGEKNRLQLAQFMKDARDLWIFDEPTNDLDLETIGILEEELRNYPGALIVVGHDRSFIENVTDKCWLLNEGQLEIFEGGWSQAEMYLEALELEKELAKKSPKSASVTSVPVQETPKSTLSNKERNRLEKVTGEMESLEKKIKALETELAEVRPTDFAKMTPLQEQIASQQAKMDKLFEEWSELESRNS